MKGPNKYSSDYKATTYRILHVPEARQSTRMKSDIGGSAQEVRLKNEQIGDLLQIPKVVILCQNVCFRRNRYGQVQICHQLVFYRRYEVGYVGFRVDLLQVYLQAIDATVLDQIDQILEQRCGETF